MVWPAQGLSLWESRLREADRWASGEAEGLRKVEECLGSLHFA
jgi:hypothetical protein